MKSKVGLGLRIILGLIYFVFGLNGFLQFIPMPPLPEGPMALMGAMMASGYLLPSIKITEIVGGFLLLSGFYVPLALLILAPITVQIFLFHCFLTPGEWHMAAVMFLMHVGLGLVHLNAYRPLFVAKNKITD